MIDAARKQGYRLIVSRGWAELALIDDAPDCLSIGEVNQQSLFKRVAAVVHHGGAGTTTAAARAGVPQLLIPQHYDQHHWARQVQGLGIGVAHPFNTPSSKSLTTVLRDVLQVQVADRARLLLNKVVNEGAYVAARAIQALST